MNAVVPVQQSELVATIEHARALYDEGDIALALKLSSVIYSQAKAAGDSAETVKASRELVDKARRMQADALKIESMCYVAMADAVDAAQAKGQIASRGRPEKVQGSDVFTLEDVGIDKRRLSEARRLRDKVQAEPDFVERVVETRMAEGFEPSRASIRNAIGTRSASNAEKGDQLYETPAEATRTLIALESFSETFKEPFVGRGAILRVMEAAGYEGVVSDLRDRGVATQHGELQGVGDFLDSRPDETCGMDIITNPPYGDLANKCLAHALRVHQPAKMAALLNLNFMCGFEDDDRVFVMQENPPSRVYVFAHRLPMMHRDGWEGPKSTSQMNTGWFVWERNEDGSYGRGKGRWETIRVDWKDFAAVPALAPGERTYVDPDDIDFPEAEEDFERATPRKTIEERVEDDRVRALVWIAEQETFDDVSLRRGIGVRPSTAEALIVALNCAQLIETDDGVAWKINDAGWLALKACAGALVGLAVVEAVEATGAAVQAATMTDAAEVPHALYGRAVELVRETRKPSTSMLQRRLGIGWNDATALIDRMTAERVLPLEKIKADGRRKVVAA